METSTVGLLVVGGMLFIIVVVALLLMVRHDKIQNFANALPVIIDAIRSFVAQAEARHAAIMDEYADHKDNIFNGGSFDPRLLWVIDQAEVWIKRQFGFTVDINWLIGHIERIVQENKRK